MKRWTLTALIVPGVALAQATGGLSNYKDQPRAEPLTETVFGVRVDDPYRWMEKAERRDELKAWVNASSAHTTTELAQLPGRPDLFKQLTEASKASDRLLSATVAGTRTFYLKLALNRQVPALWVREGGKDRLLLDPANAENGTSPRTINSYSVSPSGDLVAVNIAGDGSEVGTVIFYKVAKGQLVGEALSRVWGDTTVAWLDERTMLYARIREPAR